MRYLSVAVFALMLFSAAQVTAAEEEKSVEFVYPLVTRRAVVESELDFSLQHFRNHDGQQTGIFSEAAFRILPWWRAGVEVPAVIVHDRGGGTRGGLGDISVDNRFLVFQSIPYQARVVLGFEVDTPTGSKHRGLGGEWGVEPYAAAGIKFGALNILGSLGHEWGHLNAPHSGDKERAVKGDVTFGYELSKIFAAMLEVNSVTLTKGGEGEGLHNKTQVYLTPGINIFPIEDLTLRLGMQIPVTRAKEFYHQFHAGVTWEFD